MQDNSHWISEPTFLVGAERSGTTVLRLMLGHHPKIAWCNEFEYAVDLLSDQGQCPDLNQYYEWLETHRIFRATGFEIDRSLNYPELINSFLVQQRDLEGKSIVGATVHRHFDRVLHIWPDARYIHIIRDARDVARSCIGMGWVGNVWYGVERWRQAEQLWNQVKQIVPENRRCELSYEELIAEPVLTLTRVCEFLGVGYDEEMFDYTKNSRYEFPDPKYIAQWKRKMSERDVQLVEKKIGNLLVERGYELSGYPPINVTPMMEKQLKIENWWGRLQGRVERLGWPLVIEYYIARKLGSKEWQKKVKLQINAVYQSRLK
ncbi:sulfotransferase family protein [Capilliphycus salinus ALCB114379]|uniref:sulfotransferase family protein n=1 Tax=Capilliphycus salinus TaxID=2768948 RepID=UPI0039A5A4CF